MKVRAADLPDIPAAAAVAACSYAAAFAAMTAGHIDMIFVAPAAIGTGAGHALLVDAQARGARSLECFAANTPARRFYERHGWHVVDRYSRLFAGGMRDFVRYERAGIG